MIKCAGCPKNFENDSDDNIGIIILVKKTQKEICLCKTCADKWDKVFEYFEKRDNTKKLGFSEALNLVKVLGV